MDFYGKFKGLVSFGGCFNEEENFKKTLLFPNLRTGTFYFYKFFARISDTRKSLPIQTLIVDIDERGYDQQYDSYMYRVDGYSPHEWLKPEVLRGMYGNMWYLKKN